MLFVILRKKVKQFFKAENIKSLTGATQHPDFYSIENLWKVIGDKEIESSDRFEAEILIGKGENHGRTI